MKANFFLLAILCVMYSSSYAQSDSVDIQPNAVQYKKVIYNGNETYETYRDPSNLSIGTVKEYANRTYKQRAVLEYDFSLIPKGAHLNKIECKTSLYAISTADNMDDKGVNVSFKAASAESYDSSVTNEAGWAAIDTGAEYLSREVYYSQDSTSELTSGDELFNLVNHAIRNGEKLYLAFVCTEDTIWDYSGSTHKVYCSTAYKIHHSLTFTIAYDVNFLVTLRADYGYQDPLGVDFLIDSIPAQHGNQQIWNAADTHDLVAISHQNIILEDGEAYDLSPNSWYREPDDSTFGTPVLIGSRWWGDATTDWDAIIYALHVRFVKYQIFASEYGDLSQLPSVSIYCEQIPYTQGDIKSRYYATYSGSELDVDVPLQYYNQLTDGNYYFVDWLSEEAELFLDDANNNALIKLFPKYNRILGSNIGPFHAVYQKLRSLCIDTGEELGPLPLSDVTYSSTYNSMLVSVPYEITKTNVKYFFWKWNDGNSDNIDRINNVVTRDISVNDSSVDYSSVLTAIYKAHMISGSPFSTSEPVCGVCPNSQRKLSWLESQFGVDYLPIGIYQTAYESAERTVWYTYSLDGGVTWENELFVGYGEKPSIATDEARTYILYTIDEQMVYTELTPGPNPNADLTPVLWPAVTQRSLESPPVIEADNAQNLELVVWPRTTGELSYAIFHAHVLAEYGNLAGTGQQGFLAKHPTLAHKEGTTLYHIAWREGTAVYYMNLDIQANGSNYYGMTPSSMVLLSNYYHFAYGYPSITVDLADNPCIAWSSFDISMGKFISFRQHGPLGWGAIATFISLPNHDYWAPSVSSLTNKPSGDDLRIAHNDGINSIVAQRMSGGYWMVPGWVQAAEGMYPSVSKFAPVGSNMEVYSAPTSAPSVTVKRIQETQEHLNKNTYKRLEMGREIAVHDSTGTSTLMISNPRMMHAGSIDVVDWQYRSLEAIVDSAESVPAFMRTMPFVAEQGATLRFKLVLNMHDSYQGNASIVTELVDSLTNTVIQVIDSIPLSHLDTSLSISNVVVPLSAYTNTKIILRSRLSAESTLEEITGVEYYYDELETLEKRLGISRSNKAEDERFFLGLYPNPCQDQVTATISVPSERNISIVVSDIVGVVRLQVSNSIISEGDHSFKIDLSSLPTGRYLVVVADEYTRTSKILQVVR